MVGSIFLCVLFLPLIGSLVSFAFSFLLKRFFIYFFNTLLIWFSFFGSCYLFNFVPIGISGREITMNLGNWLTAGQLTVDWEFVFDSLSGTMILVMTFISGLVHQYAYFYMHEDPQANKFISFLSLFTFFMVFLVAAGNLMVLFVGWEGVGLSSYLLINFWYTSLDANSAAMKALMMNRIGDLFFMIGMALIFATMKTVDFTVIKVLLDYYKNWVILIPYLEYELAWVELVSFCFIIASAAKSAQLFFHTWLADAMEGPTPVSALLHSATMVTAGVYLIIRCSFIFVHAPFASVFMVFLGGMTSIVSGLIACNQWDMKKIIAYSTCSQLGLMFIACGSFNYHLALYHLMTHSFSKALLFLGSGIMIHALSGEQDIRQMGGAYGYSFFMYPLFLYSSFSLMGFPYTSGFYSKELIMNSILLTNNLSTSSFFMNFIFPLSISLTIYYSLRLVYYVFMMPYAGKRKMMFKGISFFMPTFLKVLFCILFIVSFTVGALMRDFFLFPGILYNSSLVLSTCSTSIFSDVIPFFWPILFTIVTLSFFMSTFLIDSDNEITDKISIVSVYGSSLNTFRRFVNQGFYFDYVYNYISVIMLDLGLTLHVTIEKGVLEFFGPRGLNTVLSSISQAMSLQQNSFLNDHLNLMTMNMLLTIFFAFMYFY